MKLSSSRRLARVMELFDEVDAIIKMRSKVAAFQIRSYNKEMFISYLEEHMDRLLSEAASLIKEDKL